MHGQQNKKKMVLKLRVGEYAVKVLTNRGTAGRESGSTSARWS